jgi:hypothetical protein
MSRIQAQRALEVWHMIKQAKRCDVVIRRCPVDVPLGVLGHAGLWVAVHDGGEGNDGHRPDRRGTAADPEAVRIQGAFWRLALVRCYGM